MTPATMTRQKKPKPALLPRDLRDPTGADALERRAMREFSRRIRKAVKVYREKLESIPAQPVVNARYSYLLHAALLRHLLEQADAEVAAIMLEGGEEDLWFSRGYVEVAAIRATAQQYANLVQQSPVYAAGRQSLAQLLASPAYARRIALVRARVFEEMKGLTQSVITDMARVLTDGIGRGLNPLAVARNLTEQAGIEEYRARRIARTEITTALRRAKWDEAEDAAEEYSLRTMEMHLSALSPSTRATHAARHAKLYTVEECRQWWSEGANGINCKCGTATMLMDKDGLPLVPSTQERARQAKKDMEARNYDWSKKD